MSTISTQVCMYDDTMSSLTGKEGVETWADCIIDLKDISAIRRSSDENKKDLAVVHFRGTIEYFIIKYNYDDLIVEFEKLFK